MLDLQPDTVSNKLMHSDNFIDFLLLVQERAGPYAGVDIVFSAFTSELLCRIIQSCHEDFRLKFTHTLRGMARVLTVAKTCAEKDIDNEEELSMFQNQFDTLASLLLGS